MTPPLAADDVQTMEHAARRFSGAYTGTAGTLAGYVILLLAERRRLLEELAVERSKRHDS